MNLFKFKLFANIRDRVQPKKKWIVKAQIWEEKSQRYIGDIHVTTHARTRGNAEHNAKEALRLHITDAWVMKEYVNGSK
jgi:hypothetical protein